MIDIMTHTPWAMVEIIQIRHEHKSKYFNFQIELEPVNRSIRKLQVMFIPRNTQSLDTYGSFGIY